jgi:hypothetical protein
MFNVEKGSSGGRTSKKESVIDHILGELHVSTEGRWWECSVTINKQVIQFQIGGESEPSPALVANAQAIVNEFFTFDAQVAKFLKDECDNKSGAASEIHQLRVESIYLPWPDRPKHGLIYFHGPNEDHIWHCDYVAGQLQCLTFDD